VSSESLARCHPRGVRLLLGCRARPGSGCAPHHACTLHAVVTDEDGATIHGIFAVVRAKRPVAAPQPVPISPTGAFRVTLAPALYDLFVTAAGFQPLSEVVDLRSCQPVDLNLMLLLDSEHAP
jgi:hypothetical protein